MWTDKYIGIPYKPNGRDQNGLDCWGLVRLVYSEQYNIELPSFSSEYCIDDDQRIKELFAQYSEGWEQKDICEPGDLILFRIFGDETHVGVAVSDSEFIHVREGSNCVKDSFLHSRWANRIAGFYKYKPDTSIVLNSVPHPLKTQRYVDIIKPGTTLQQIYENINAKYSISEELNKTVTIIVNGIVVPKQDWSTTITKLNDTIEYRAVPGKQVIRAIAVIAVIAIAIETGGLSEAFFSSAEWGLGWGEAAAKVGSMVVTATVAQAGMALINALAPIRTPSSQDPGTGADLNLITGATNQFNPYGGIPIVLGKIRYTPPLGARNYMMYPSGQSADQYLHMILLWGYGPLTIYQDTMKIGEVLWTNYEFNTDLPNGGKITLDQKTTPTTEELSYFDQIYGQDVTQQYSGLEMVGPSAAEASAIPVSDTAFIYSDSNGNTYTGYSNSVTGMVRIPEVRTDPLFRELAA